jgi:K+-sensing histidine kinase KdpD
MNWANRHSSTLIGLALALVAPLLLTLLLLRFQTGVSRDYAFLYLAIVAALGLTTGLLPALFAAAVAFLFVDYFFVAPIHAFSIADETDLVNLLVFFATAGVLGGLASRRRRMMIRAGQLSHHLTEANLELERLYREQAQSARTAVRLAQAQQQVNVLQEADRLRRELLQNVSHELRTPLGSILVGATSLESRSDLPPQVREDLAAIVRQSRRLDRLVGDMLDLARIEGHALDLHLEPTDMREASEAAADRLRRVRPEREVKIDVDDGPLVVLADWDRLGQVLDNLLGNADRYGPPATPIEVRISRGARETALTRVVDHGPGVSAQLRPHVFERFVSDNRDGSDGTGLGLAIVRGLIEAHAGRVWLDDSAPGEGAVFAFTLPAVPAVPQAAA